MLEGVKRVHFVGIGGTGMAPLAQVLLESGLQVQGSDLRASATTARLAAAGARVFEGHRAEQVEGAELVVISSAVPEDNPELLRARALGLTIAKRAEVWGELMRRQRAIAIAGTHGKTTTSAMVATLLGRAGLDPTCMVGGELLELGSGAKLGRGRYLVAEADEFDGSFLKFVPWTAVLTNIEADHLDYYGSLDAVVDAFQRFIALLPADGHAVLCWDDPRVRALTLPRGTTLASYGFGEEAEWRATGVRPNEAGGNDFRLLRGGEEAGAFRLQLPGRHNVSNAVGALAVGGLLGIAGDVAYEALANFRGTRRRLEFRGAARGVTVYDDYAHHPTEVKATLAAARERHSGRLWVVFQPHTYHRTKRLLPEFATAFELADRVLVADIYLPPGREADTLGITARDLVQAMEHRGARYVGALDAAVAYLTREVRPGDWVLTMGAGDVDKVAEATLARLGDTGDVSSAEGAGDAEMGDG